MRTRTFSRIISLLAVTALIGGCNGGPTASEDRIHKSDRFEPRNTSLRVLLTKYADNDPAFGGVWVDSRTAEIVIGVKVGEALLTPPNDIVAIVKSRIPALALSATKLAEVDYSLAELNSFREKISNNFREGGIVGVGIRKSSNKVQVWTESEASLSAARGFLARLAIPEAAVALESDAVIRAFALLTDKNRQYIENGFRISNFDNQKCSHGADAMYFASGTEYPGFLTAAHCSDGIEAAGSPLFQANKNLSDNVGVEAVDPVGFTGSPCPTGYRCRYSDVSYVLYTGDYYAGKKIAETTVVGTGTSSGNLTVGLYRPAPTTTDIIEGLAVRKTGQTTGTTQGVITNDCFDSLHPDVSGLRILCSALVSARAGEGDSGAPVYVVNGSGAYHAGILWAGDSQGSSNLYFFSPWEGIHADLPNVLY